MKQLVLVGMVVISALSGCTTTDVEFVEPVTNTGYISSVSVYGYSPSWSENYFYGVNTNWYGGTPDYYSPSIYSYEW